MTIEQQGPIPPVLQARASEIEGLTALGLFERRLAAGDQRPMIHARGTTLSAYDADVLSAALAGALRQRDVGPGDRVALLLQNDPQFPIAQLAIWRCGAIAVPLNPMLRERELTEQLRETRCEALICLRDLTASALPAAAAAGVCHIAVTDADELLGGGGRAGPLGGAEPLSEWLDTAPWVDLTPEPSDIAVITYTSGTTGPAKGACSTHSNLAWAAHIYRDWVALDESMVVLGAAPLFHVTGQVGHLAIADLLAAPIILDHRFDAQRLLRASNRHGATFVVAAATAFRALLAVSDRAPATFNRLVMGAQAVSPVLAAAVESWSGCYPQNIYGMTETTSPALAVPSHQRAPVDPDTGALSVGMPVTSTDAVIVDPDSGLPVPAGTPGELLVKGPQVITGYWRRSDADEEAFNHGWLRSGDLAKVDEDGWFYLLDRIKDLINSSGFKVSPREVEEVLLEFPGVHDAAVVGEPDEYRGERVLAYVVPANGELDVDRLMEHCRTTLAAYKCPRWITTVAEIPRTVSGKTLRRKLSRPSPEQ